MNKYFYPIYKMKLKPWIKYWLLKKLNNSGESTLKVETISSGTLKKVDKSKSLSIKEYYGNTVQNGTPTPETPIEIQTITGDNTFTINSSSYRVDLGGKNILKNTLIITETTRNGITATPNADGSITLNGTATANVYLNLCRIDFGTTSFNSVTGGSSQYVASTSNPSNLARITYDANNKYTYILVYNGNTLDNFTIYPMIEKGTQATPFSPYTANPIELNKIGNYQDRIYKENDKWYIEKNIGKVVLNESSNIVKYDNNGRYYIRGILATKGSTSSPNAMSNYFKGAFAISNGNIFSSSVDGTINMTNTSYLNDLAGFKTWLGTTTPIVYYVLATPTYTEITDTNLITQLNALYEFYVNSSTVNISNNSEIPFEVLLEYYGR